MPRPPIPSRTAPVDINDQIQNRNNELLHRRLEDAEDRLNSMNGLRWLGRQTFTKSGTYVPTPGTRSAIVRICGGGGGGGGATPGGLAGQYAAGSGGSSGVTLEFTVSSKGSGADLPGGHITIGAAGTGGAVLDGTAGGDSSIIVGGRSFVAAGGGGGPSCNNSGFTSYVADGGRPRTTTTPLTVVGVTRMSADAGGISFMATSFGSAFSGDGGSGGLGIGGRGAVNSDGLGAAGQGYGAGGGGAGVDPGSGTTSGGNGAPGVCIIDEYAG